MQPSLPHLRALFPSAGSVTGQQRFSRRGTDGARSVGSNSQEGTSRVIDQTRNVARPGAQRLLPLLLTPTVARPPHSCSGDVSLREGEEEKGMHLYVDSPLAQLHSISIQRI